MLEGECWRGRKKCVGSFWLGASARSTLPYVECQCHSKKKTYIYDIIRAKKQTMVTERKRAMFSRLAKSTKIDIAISLFGVEQKIGAGSRNALLVAVAGTSTLHNTAQATAHGQQKSNCIIMDTGETSVTLRHGNGFSGLKSSTTWRKPPETVVVYCISFRRRLKRPLKETFIESLRPNITNVTRRDLSQRTFGRQHTGLYRSGDGR